MQYDAASRLQTLGQDFAGTSQDLTLGFQYTPASQLQTRRTSNPLYEWMPTASTASYVPDGLNRYTSVSGTYYRYDDGRGNLTSDGANTYTYDVENRLLTASGPIQVTLSYDPLGRLQQTQATTGTTQFLYSGTQLIAEYDGSGNLLRRYVFGPGNGDDPIVWYEGADLSQRTHLHADERGSIIATSNSGGTSTPYLYGSYGEPLPLWSGSRFRYTGQMAIPEANLYYYKARVFSPVLGRFLQTDPVGGADELNLYVYAGDDPPNEADPTGLAQVCTSVTGSRIPACVGVDGNGDGNVNDNDLTKSQIQTLSHDFAPFIQAHNGQNLSKSGAEVFGDDEHGDKGNFVRAVSQFVGTAMGGWPAGVGMQLANTEGLRYLSMNMNAESDVRAASPQINGINFIVVNTDAPSTFTSGGNAARDLIHENIHIKTRGLELTSAGHQYVDARARQLLKAWGLGAGGCESVGGFFGYFPTYPACD